MTRTIKVISVVNLILIGLAFTAFLLCVLFQRSIAVIFVGNYSPEIIGYLPMIQAGSIVYISGMTAVVIFQFISASRLDRGIWVDILFAVATALVLPVIEGILSYLQPILFVNVLGSAAVAAYSVASQILSFPMSLVRFSVTLVMLICGMSIAAKRMHRHNNAVI